MIFMVAEFSTRTLELCQKLHRKKIILGNNVFVIPLRRKFSRRFFCANLRKSEKSVAKTESQSPAYHPSVHWNLSTSQNFQQCDFSDLKWEADKCRAIIPAIFLW